MNTKPQATFFAGTNGAGKTTLYYNELELQNDFGFRINIDEIVSSFGNPKNSQDQIRASKIAIKIRRKCIQELRNFNQESTLCGASILSLFPKLKNKNYQINLYYVGVESPELAKQRIKIRVAKGGHYVKDELVEKRYFESLKRLEKICHLCDRIIVFDNSKEFQKILEFENETLKLYKETKWIKGLLNKLYSIENNIYKSTQKPKPLFSKIKQKEAKMKNNLLKILLEEKNKAYKNGLYHYTQIHFAYNSNHIEGSKLTREQTSLIYETHSFLAEYNQLIKINDILEARNHFNAFDFILENALRELDTNFIKTLHSLVKQNCTDIQIIGDFKKKQNFVGDIKTTNPKEVAKEINALLKRYAKQDSLEKIVDFHFYFERIHPFEDGNGRVGRLLMFKECLKNDIVPFVIDEEHKLFYYRGLKNYENTKGFLLDTCLSCQDKYNEILEYFKGKTQHNSSSFNQIKIPFSKIKQNFSKKDLENFIQNNENQQENTK